MKKKDFMDGWDTFLKKRKRRRRNVGRKKMDGKSSTD
jgi:hypothetical protein